MKNLSCKILLTIGVFLALNPVFKAQTAETKASFEVQKIADDGEYVIRKETLSLWDSQHKSFAFQNYIFLPATAAAF